MNVLEFKKRISPGFRKKLRFHALISTYSSYISLKGTQVGLEWAHADYIDASELTNNIPFTSTGQYFTKFKANNFIDPHVDDHSTRTSCLSIALSPSLDIFAPVLYYDKFGDDAVITETYHYTTNPVILNTTLVHAMYNNDNDRYIFQIQYQEPIDSFLTYAEQL